MTRLAHACHGFFIIVHLNFTEKYRVKKAISLAFATLLLMVLFDLFERRSHHIITLPN